MAKDEQSSQVAEEKVAEAVEPSQDAAPEDETPAAVTTDDDAQSDSDKRPGGADPQAVRARKEYQARVRAQRELQQEREARIALESRLKALEETRTRPEKPHRYSAAEIESAIEQGTISRADGMDYLARVRAEELYEAKERERTEREQRQRPAQTALAKIAQYREVAPWIDDPLDPRRNQLARAYNEIKNDYGLIDEHIAEALAVERVLGPIDKLRTRQQVATDTRRNVPPATEASAGGGGGVVMGKDPMQQVPKHLIDYWEKTNTPLETRKREAALYVQRPKMASQSR